jgi:molecular chaperone GrpE
MGLAAAQNPTQAASICEGMSMVLNQLHALLRSEDVEVIDAIGKHFDPHLHEALGQVETTEHPEGTVVQQHRKGYKLKDRLLRPAAVLVAKAPH